MVKVEKNARYIRASPRKEKVMAVSKANQRAVNKYVKNNYDRVNVTMPKGRKEIIQAHAEAHSESVNGFINRAIQDNAAAGAAEGRTEDKERAGE